MSEVCCLIPRSFIRNFINVYVHTSINAALSRPRLEDFDRKVWEEVSQKLGIDLEMTKKLHHPLDWELLSITNDTPLEVYSVYSNGCDNVMHIKQRREYSEIEREKFCGEVEKKHRELMESKLRLLVNQQR